MHEKFNYKHLITIVVIVCVTLLGVISILRDKFVQNDMNQVSFTAEGTVFAKPDIAQITLGIKTERKATAVEAVQENTEQMNKLIQAVKDQGIEEGDIKTTSYNVNPSYDYEIDKGRSEIKGYEVYQNVTVKIRDLDSIGKVIESATSAGANQIGNISFTIDDMSEIKKLARAEAVAKAQEKAKEMSEITGLKLGKLINVYENEGYYSVYKNYSLDVAEEAGYASGMGVSPDIQVGENEINLSVTLVYKVK